MDLEFLSKSCVKCAKCVPSCTIYQINRDEVTSPRGFVDLLGVYNGGKIELDKNLKNIFESCFLCTTCTTLCPQNIDTANMIIQARIDIAKKFGISWYKRAYFWLLRHRKIMDFVFSFSSFAAPCAFKASDDKLRSRFNLGRFGKRTIFPFAKKSFINAHKNKCKIPKDAQKVAIFIGCLSNYNYPQVGNALLEILDILNIGSFIPKQECCGAPAYFTGDIETVNFLIKKNIILFEKFFNQIDAMLIPEATCAAMIKEDWKHALAFEPDGKAWIARLERLLPKIYMASDFLYKHTNLMQLLASKPAINTLITYHDPCHAKKVLNIAKEPRALLKNYNFIELNESDRCCGFGGVTMQSQKYYFAFKAGIAKAKEIAKTNAEILSSECSACRMQLNNAIDNANLKTAFKHPLELICAALKQTK